MLRALVREDIGMRIVWGLLLELRRKKITKAHIGPCRSLADLETLMIVAILNSLYIGWDRGGCRIWSSTTAKLFQLTVTQLVALDAVLVCDTTSKRGIR